MNNILLTGGSGLLGTELQKHIKCDAPDSLKFDITNPDFPSKKYDLIIHAAAYTEVDRAEGETEKVFDVNLGGTINMLLEYSFVPFIYISSEYAHNPVNMYSASKYAGEVAVRCLAEKYLIIRTLFKAFPWTLATAWQDQWTQGDYVSVIAPLIVQEIIKWDTLSKTVLVGTERKTMYQLARRTKPDVIPTNLSNYQGVKRPYDYL
jgi:dTDP-4-dehydrorhamnose reductase